MDVIREGLTPEQVDALIKKYDGRGFRVEDQRETHGKIIVYRGSMPIVSLTDGPDGGVVL